MEFCWGARFEIIETLPVHAEEVRQGNVIDIRLNRHQHS